MKNKRSHIFLTIFFVIICVINAPGKQSSIGSKRAKPVFNSKGELFTIYKNSEDNIVLEKFEPLLEEPAEILISDSPSISSFVIEKDRDGRTWTVWEEQRLGQSRFLMGELMGGRIVSSHIITDQSGFNYSPDLQFDRYNTPWLTWINYKDRKTHVFVKNLASGQTWDLSSEYSRNSTVPKIVVGYDDLVWVFWSGREGEERGLYYRILERDVWSPLKRMENKNNFPQLNPQAAVDLKGLIWLVWSAFDGTDYELFSSCWNGTSWSSRVNISDNEHDSDTFPSLSLVGDDIPVVAWEKSGRQGNQIYLTYLQNGVWQDKIKVSSLGTQNRFPGLVSQGEQIGIVWQSQDQIRAKTMLYPQLGNNPDPPPGEFSFETFQASQLVQNRFLCFGNSITSGVMHGVLYPDLAYPVKLEALLDGKYGDHDVVNAGIGGELTADGLARFEGEVTTHTPRYLCLMEGTNDMHTLEIDMSTAAFNLEQMVIICQNHGVYAAIASIIPNSHWRWKFFVGDPPVYIYRERIHELNGYISDIAQNYNIPFVNQFDSFYDYVLDWPKTELYSDSVHPNEAGYQVMAETWFAEIEYYPFAPFNFVTTPDIPEGLSLLKLNTSFTFTTGGSACSKGHPVEYRLDWGDGQRSAWSTTPSFSHEWTSKGTYKIKAKARCTDDQSITSPWSSEKTVTVAGNVETISGTIKSDSGEVIEGVLVSFSDRSDVISTDSNGYYLMTVYEGWSGTATPIKGGYSFSPSNRSYSNVTSDLTGEDYTVVIPTYSISGQINLASNTGIGIATAGLSGVVMSGLPGDPITDASGRYSATVDHGWTGTVTPAKTDYTFSPLSRSYSNVRSDQTDQDYDATPVQYTLTITSGLAGTTDPPPGSYTYDAGTEVTVTAIPEIHYSFTSWSGDAAGSDNPITITIDSDKSITANFSIIQHDLSLSSSPGGTVDPPPGTYTYDEGSEVTITAIPEAGYGFLGWSGDASGSDNPVTITINSDKSITSNFIQQHNLSITSGSGGTTDPPPGTYTYNEGSEATITAIPEAGYGFLGWSGDVSGSDNPITITIDSDKSITATFIKQHSLSIVSNSGGTTDPLPGTYLYDEDSQVTITAIPEPGYRFSSWSGDASGSDNPVTITIDSDKSIAAAFIKQHSLSITSGSGGTTDPPPGTYTYDEGTEVSITAIPEAGYRFAGWSGDSSGSDNPITITMNSDKSIAAEFIHQYTLTIASDTGGTTDPPPGSYIFDQDTEITVTAIAESDYEFALWTGDITGAENPVIIKLDSDKTLTAAFLKIVFAPINFSGNKVINRSLSQSEYINELSWQANPDNVDVVKYRIYLVQGGQSGKASDRSLEKNAHILMKNPSRSSTGLIDSAQKMNQNLVLLTELNADTFTFLHRNVESNLSYTYALVAVNSEEVESDPIYLTVD